MRIFNYQKGILSFGNLTRNFSVLIYICLATRYFWWNNKSSHYNLISNLFTTLWLAATIANAKEQDYLMDAWKNLHLTKRKRVNCDLQKQQQFLVVRVIIAPLWENSLPLCSDPPISLFNFHTQWSNLTQKRFGR